MFSEALFISPVGTWLSASWMEVLPETVESLLTWSSRMFFLVLPPFTLFLAECQCRKKTASKNMMASNLLGIKHSHECT